MTKRNIILTITAALISVPLFASTAMAASCGGAETSVIQCSGTGESAIIDLIKIVVRIMTAGVMILAVGATVFGGILYTTSEGSPDKIKKAREVWTNTVIGMLLYAFMVAITNFIVPGGVF